MGLCDAFFLTLHHVGQEDFSVGGFRLLINAFPHIPGKEPQRLEIIVTDQRHEMYTIRWRGPNFAAL